MAGSVRLKQIRSANGLSHKQRETLRSLGLGRIGKTSERRDEPTVRGQIHAVGHLIEVQDG